MHLAGQCTEGIITYEKITGYRLRNAQSNPLGPQLTGNTANCLNQCKTDQSPLCRSVHVDYNTGTCFRLDRDSQGDRENDLIPQLGVSYFEQVCLRGTGLFLKQHTCTLYWQTDT